MRRSAVSLETATAAIFALEVVLTSFGSSGVDHLRTVGSPGRWLTLVALWLCAALLAYRLRHGAPSRPLVAVIAAAAAFAALALLSVGWSAAGLLSAERGLTFAVAASALALFAYAVEAQPDLAWSAVAGLVWGAAAVCVGGVLVWVFDRHAAVQPGTDEMVARWRGIGENPNTAALLCGVLLPIALALAARTRVAWLAVLVLALTLIASQSRGALAGALVGVVLYSILRPGRRPARAALAVGAVAVLLVGALVSPTVINRLSPPLTAAQWARLNHLPPPGPGQPGPGAGPTPSQRSVTTVSDSGRLAAWRGALREADRRPVLGYGFGTEERVFLSGRYRIFQGSRPENSYLGTYLQLGGLGVLVLCAAVAAALVGLAAGVRRRLELAAALLGTIVAGLTLAVVQSYVYSVGNIAMVSFWTALMLAPVVRT